MKAQKYSEEKQYDIKRYEYLLIYKEQLQEKLLKEDISAKDLNILKDEVINFINFTNELLYKSYNSFCII